MIPVEVSADAVRTKATRWRLEKKSCISVVQVAHAFCFPEAAV
jgi:hypothetical protein